MTTFDTFTSQNKLETICGNSMLEGVEETRFTEELMHNETFLWRNPVTFQEGVCKVNRMHSVHFGSFEEHNLVFNSKLVCAT